MMKMWKQWMLVVAAAVAFVGLSASLQPTRAEACSCQEPDLSRTYSTSTNVIRGRILKKLNRRGGRLLYYVQVEEVYKGCLKRGSVVKAMTSRLGSTCGVTWLERGESYLLTSAAERGYLRLFSCGYNKRFDRLSEEEVRYLDTRENCCGDRCACVNSERVECFADPCATATCEVEGSACVSNTCGGCSAEFYDSSGALVCDGSEPTACRGDDDCGDGAWCRPNQEGVNACVPFQEEGGWCGGFTPIWDTSRCSPDLVCTDVPPFLADAPGICREPCEDNRACGADGYCSSNNDVCREDGACWADNDCEAPGNGYANIDCTGYGVCGDDDRCSWVCGDPACRELSGHDFGFCDAVLGWGVVNGACAVVSGCDAGSVTLYRSEAACQEACGGGPPSCEGDDDCAEGSWCRPTQEGGSACVPFQQEGDFCGGFTPAWGATRCAPELICTDAPPLVADAPGICRAPCEDNRACGEGGYCSSNNDVCREDGACWADNDCEAPGNDYPHIECVGYGVCGDDGQCGWQCGDASCRDLAGVFLGFCRFTLGWAVIDGACAQVSGCPEDAQGYTFFDDEASCLRSCGDR